MDWSKLCLNLLSNLGILHNTGELNGLRLLVEVVNNFMVARKLEDVTVKVDHFFSELRAELFL